MVSTVEPAVGQNLKRQLQTLSRLPAASMVHWHKYLGASSSGQWLMPDQFSITVNDFYLIIDGAC